jgi:nucleotide-binding universal stress UspA family protein
LLDHVTAMAHLLGARLHFFHVVVPSPVMPSILPSAEGGLGARENAATVALARERLNRLATSVRDKGGSASAEVVIGLTAAAGVLGELKARPYAMVAVCTQQAGLARRIFLGSTASRVIHESNVPVFVFDPSGPDVS